ncbi:MULTISPECIES: XkdX family protein [Lactiplantibacillus]|nr:MULTISPECIES: XkdX family protein [Lactiplantibacillus]MCB7175675.1 XkdX family protein [Lactiplantibacillus plantarum]
MNSKENGFYDFAKMMYGAGQSIRAYVVLNFITADQYKEITGTDYAA